MIINKLQLKNFGRFQNRELILKPGINVVYGGNGSGKSTIHTFLQSMLFGMKRMRGRASRTDSYNKYMPWENAGWYEGAMTFTCGEKRFQLERNFQKNKEESVLFCETDGELLSVKDGDLDMLLGNISEVVYCNTVSVGQAKSTTQEGLYKELRDYLAEFQGSGDMHFDPEKAVEILKQKRKQKEKQEEIAAEKKEKEEERLAYEIRHEQEEIRNLKQKQQEFQIQAAKLAREERQAQDAEQTEGARRETSSRKGLKLMAAAGFFLCFLLFVFGKIPWYLMIMGAVFLVVVWLLPWLFPGFIKASTKKEEPNVSPSDTGKVKLQERLGMLNENLQERQRKLENLQAEYEEARQEQGEILSARREIRTLLEAERRIKEAAARMQKKTGGVLQKKLSQIFSSLTQGKYQQIILDEDFNIHLSQNGKLLALHQVSFGTMEQVYLALRLACGEILCQEEDLPLVLDETFAMYDDNRLCNTLRWLHENYSQVILFSCHKREIQALEGMGILYHLVEL